MVWRSKLPIAIAAALLLGACTLEDSTANRAPAHLETQAQALGESSQAVTFAGDGSGVMPTYEERVAMHLINRARTAPYVWNIMVDTDGDGNPDSPAVPQAPGRYQHFFSEAGRWQGDHAIANQCFCGPNDDDPDQYNATCCEIGWDEGVAKCVGPRVECSDQEGRTTGRERWEVLNLGPGEITRELFWNGDNPTAAPVPGEFGGAFIIGNADWFPVSDRNNAFGVAQVNKPVVPDECLPPANECTNGVCQDTNGSETCDEETDPNCLGICQGDGTDPESPEPCTLPAAPDPEVCDSSTWAQLFYWSFSTGRSSEPPSALSDGIAVQFGATATEMRPDGFFGITPAGETEFTVHYWEPAGPAQSLEVVVRGQCSDMEYWITPPNVGGPAPVDTDMGADMDTDMDTDMGQPGEEAPYAGITYKKNLQLTAGCQRYFFAVTDGEGFVTRYPTLGSLGVIIAEDGTIAPNDASCPAWDASADAGTCLDAADQCNDGDTRPCYTGRNGTQDQGICGAGVETCGNGRWSGLCEGETRPDPEEVCGDSLDNNCNGVTDENCPIVVVPEDMGGEPDLGPALDMGTDMSSDGDKGNGDDEGCGCSSIDGNQKSTPWTLVLGLLTLGFFFQRRRR